MRIFYIENNDMGFINVQLNLSQVLGYIQIV